MLIESRPVKNLIPHFIHKRFKARRTHGRFQAVTLFVDISGFTPLTERLMQHEKDGAEVLTDVLNHIFQPLVAEVYTQGGFVTTFAGDAFTVVFPLKKEVAVVQHALAAATFIQDFFARQGRFVTRYGQFEMGVKVQILKRGTMFAMRATKLYEAYRAYGSIEEMPPASRAAWEMFPSCFRRRSRM